MIAMVKKTRKTRLCRVLRRLDYGLVLFTSSINPNTLVIQWRGQDTEPVWDLDLRQYSTPTPYPRQDERVERDPKLPSYEEMLKRVGHFGLYETNEDFFEPEVYEPITPEQETSITDFLEKRLEKDGRKRDAAPKAQTRRRHSLEGTCQKKLDSMLRRQLPNTPIRQRRIAMVLEITEAGKRSNPLIESIPRECNTTAHKKKSASHAHIF